MLVDLITQTATLVIDREQAKRALQALFAEEDVEEASH